MKPLWQFDVPSIKAGEDRQLRELFGAPFTEGLIADITRPSALMDLFDVGLFDQFGRRPPTRERVLLQPSTEGRYVEMAHYFEVPR